MIRNLPVERLFLNVQPLLLGSIAKWLVLFTIIILFLTIYRKLSSDVRHVVILLLIYAVVLIPFANIVFPHEWFGDTTLARQGNEIIKTVNTAITPDYMEGAVKGESVGRTTHQSFTLSSTPDSVAWPMILFTIWAVGVVTSSIGLVIGRCRVGVLCRKDCDNPTDRYKKELENLAKKLGIRRRVGLVIINEYQIPFTFRVFNPLIVLSRTIESWPLERVKTVILHELSHIRRCDYLTKLLARIVCSLFWFLPFLWIAFSFLSREQETACDLSVLRRGIRPIEYARHILDIASISIRNLSFQGSFLAEGRKKTLERRIMHALQFDRGKIVTIGTSKKKITKLVLVLTLLVAAIVIVGSSVSSKKYIFEKALITAVVKGDSIEAEALLQAGADVEAKSSSGQTVLMYAVRRGHTEVVQLLLDEGADVNATNDAGDTALYLAAWLGDVNQIVQLLLDAGASVNYKKPNSETILTVAAWNGNTETVRLLLAEGADVNTKNGYGKTALTVAIGKRHEEVENVLRNAGAKE